VASAARDLFVDAVRDRVGFDATQARRNRDGWRPSMLVVNPSPALRSEVVEATLAYHVADIPVGRPRDLESVQERLCSATTTPPVASVVVKDSDGHAIPAQVLDRYSAYDRLDSPRDYPDQDQVEAVRVALQVADVPPLGVKRFAVETGSAAPAARDGVRADGAALLSSWCEVRAAADAAVTVHPRAEPFVLDAVGQLESERDEGDTYTFQPVDGDRRAVAEWGVPRVVWRGPLIACLARDFVVADRARGVMYVRLRAGSGMIDYVVDGVNLCGNHRLRISFPTPRGSDDRRSVADMQFGPVMRRRESHDRRAYPFEWPVVTAPMHRYVSAGGLTVCARGIFEYEHHDDGRLLLTLLRATGELSRGNLQARPGHAGWPRPTPDAQEPGGFRAELAIRIDGADQSSTAAAWSELERAVESFDAPLAGIMLRPAIDLPDRIAGPTLDGEGLVFKSLKPAESGDAVVMRCVNVSERRVRGAVRWPGGFGAVSRARLDETPVDDRRLRVAGDQLSFVAEPREVVTLLFRP
jgi:alpha-mannosidase